MTKTIWVCGKCGETSEEWFYTDDWLVAPVPGSKAGEMVIRCPKCVTEYAVRKAGGKIGNTIGYVGNREYEIPKKGRK